MFRNQPLTSAPTQQVPVSDLGNISIVYGNSNDNVTVDYSGGDPIHGGLGYLSYGTAPATSPHFHVVGLANATYQLGFNYLNITAAGTTDQLAFGGPGFSSTQFDLLSGGGTDLLKVTSGTTVDFQSDLGASRTTVNLNVSSGSTVVFDSAEHLNTLNISSGASVRVTPTGGIALNVNSLSVAGTLDLANNDLIVRTPTTAAMTTLQQQVRAGVTAAASSSGVGTTQGLIYSSTARVDNLTLGVAPASQVGLTTLDGQAVPSTALVARYTVGGDATLDGLVDDSDVTVLSNNFGRHPGVTPPQWYNGDFNYDGYVNIIDLNILGPNYNTDLGVSPTNVTAGTPFTLTLPTSTSAGTPVRWDISWGDGTFDSYDYGINPVHTYTAVFDGPGLIQATAVTNTGDTSVNAGFGQYHLPAIPLNINSAASVVPLSITAAADDVFAITRDTSGHTIITQNGNIIDTVLTASLLSLKITGDTRGTLNIDYANGDPLPAAGMTTDSRSIVLTGGNGADSLITTSGTAVFSNSSITASEVRHLPTATVGFPDAGPGDTVIALAGVVQLAGPAATALTSPAGASVWVYMNAEVILTGSQHLSALNVLTGGTARMAEDGTAVLTVDSLQLGYSQAYVTGGAKGGILDLTDNDLIIHDGGGSQWGYLLAGGYAFGNWNGVSYYSGSIVSSTAAADPAQLEALGYTQIDTGYGTGQPSRIFDGRPVYYGDTIVKFTYYGDANLDGVVNNDDAIILSSNHTGYADWSGGDFDYDGTISTNDYDLMNASMTTPLVPGSLTLNEWDRWPTLPTATPDGKAISSWSIDCGDGAGRVPFDPASTSNYISGNFTATLTPKDALGNYNYHYGRTHVVLVPSAPTNLSATESTAGEVDLTWTDDSIAATNYVVTATRTGGGNPITHTYNSSTFAGSFTGLLADVNYTFTVTADNVISDTVTLSSTPATTIAAAATTTLAATGPTSVAEGSTGSTLNLSSGSSSNITGWTVLWIDQTGATVRTDTVSGSNGTDGYPATTSAFLFAFVTAHDTAQAALHLPLFEVDVIPASPSNLTTAAISSTEVDISWTNNSGIVSQFAIQRSINGGTFEPIDVVSAGALTYADTSLNPLDSARYEVVAVGVTTAVSSPSAASVVIDTPAGVPTLSVAAATDGTFSAALTYSYQGNDAANFEVERRDVTAGENFEFVHALSSLAYGDSATDEVTLPRLDHTYQFRMRAIHRDGTASKYTPAQTFKLQRASTPNFNVSRVYDSFDTAHLLVSWKDVPLGGAVEIEFTSDAYFDEGWILYQAGGSINSGIPATSVSSMGNAEGYTGSVLDPGVRLSSGTYHYRIRTITADQRPSEWTSDQTGSLGSGSAPGVSTGHTSTAITMHWTGYADAGTTENYEVYLAGAGKSLPIPEPLTVSYLGSNGSQAVIAPQDAPRSQDLSLYFIGLTPGTTYHCVLVEWLAGDTGYGYAGFTQFNVTTDADTPVTLKAPLDLVATWDATGNTAENHHASLHWKNMPNNEGSFQLQRSTDQSFSDASTTNIPIAADNPKYQDSEPDYDHFYYYRVRAVNGTQYSAWSDATLSPGPIIVMFFGADVVGMFPNGDLPDKVTGLATGNRGMQQIEAHIQQRGYQIHEFAADRVGSAFDWLLSQLDTNGNGKYDPSAATSPDIHRPIEIFGHSWGGISVSYLANAIKDHDQFEDKIVYRAIAIDPVDLGRFFSDGRIHSNVDFYTDLYQRNPAGGTSIVIPIIGLPVVTNIRGIRVDADSFFRPLYEDIFSESTPVPKDIEVNHFKIVADVQKYVENELEM